MKVQYTKKEMTALARLALGFDHARDDIADVQTDALDVDTLMARLTRGWYLHLLDTAPLTMLAVGRIDGASVAYNGTVGGATTVVLPAECRRCTAVALPGWSGAVVPEAPEALGAVTELQLNPYTAATAAAPVAVLAADGRSVLCWPPLTLGTGGTPVVYGARDTGEELYEFDESALSTLSVYLDQHYKNFE